MQPQLHPLLVSIVRSKALKLFLLLLGHTYKTHDTTTLISVKAFMTYGDEIFYAIQFQ